MIGWLATHLLFAGVGLASGSGDDIGSLWRKYCEGDQNALGELFKKLNGSLFHVALKYLHRGFHRDMVNDVIVDVFKVLLMDKTRLCEEVDDPEAYITTMTKNAARTKVRNFNRFQALDDLNEIEETSSYDPEDDYFILEELLERPATILTEEQWHQAFDDAKIKRESRERDIMELTYIKRLDMEDIATVLKVDIADKKKRQNLYTSKYNGKQKLRGLGLAYWINLLKSGK